jgi:hypothetical protein
MYQKIKNLVVSANTCSAMEPETIQKNGASPKSQTIRTNFKLFALFAFFALFGLNAMAQDVIVTKDAKKINAKVTEVKIDNIKYKNFDNQDGPTYTLLKSAVSSILYQNGTVETFGEDKTAPGLRSTPAPATSTTPSTRAYSAQQRRAFSYSNMQNDNPLLYQRYAAGKSQASMGWMCILVGVAGVAVGAGDAILESNGKGGIFIGVGAVCIGVGIPVTIAGNKKKKSAMNEYRMRYSEASGENAPHFQLNVHPNGLGLAYVF